MTHYISQIKATVHQWYKQPLRVAFVLILTGLVMLSGPWACVVHCTLLDSLHTSHPAMSHVHGLNAAHVGLECPADLQAPYHVLDLPPSAITQGIVLPLDMLVIIVGVAVLALALPMLCRPVFLAPPREPPRVLRFAV